MSRPTIIVISGGFGTSGNQIARTALAQFATHDVDLIITPHVRDSKQLEEAVTKAASIGGVIIHTLVDTTLRHELVRLAETHRVSEVDLMGPLLDLLTQYLGEKPLGQPGLYRKMREQDLKRIEAIEFAVEHDDGKRVHELQQADIILAGVSRVGKTPLSMYLSTLGWKVANVPLVRSLKPPSILFEIDHRRVIGLTIEPGQLISYRKHRSHHLGIAASSSYTAPTDLIEELEFARSVFRQGSFAIVDTTDKSIEESADEIITRVSQRLKFSGAPLA